MRATLICDAHQPVEFIVRDGRGEKVVTGWSEVWPVRPEPTSGLVVHVLDFTGGDDVGSGFWVEAAGQRSHPFAICGDLYAGLGQDALRFFFLMRSGAPIPEQIAPGYGRPAGHVGRAPNTGDTAVPAWTGPDAERVYPGWRCPGTFDVSGGWYDAGDYGKYTTSAGLSQSGSC